MIDFLLVMWLLPAIVAWIPLHVIVQRNSVARLGGSDALTDTAASFILALAWPILLLVVVVAMAYSPRSNQR